MNRTKCAGRLPYRRRGDVLSEGSIFVIPSENARPARTEESLTRRKYLEMSRLRSTRQKRPERRRQNVGYCEQNARATPNARQKVTAPAISRSRAERFRAHDRCPPRY